MIIREITADVFLGVAVAIAVISAVGVLVMRDTYQKLHFVGPAALVSPVLVTLAVWLHVGNTATTLEAMLALLFVVIAGPYLSHATIRAARIRETGDWRPGGPGHAPPLPGEGKQGS